MMKAEYKRDMNHNYLILYQEEPVDTASYQVRMLVGNVIPSVLKCRMQGVDGQLMVYYDITSRQPLASLFEDKKLNHEDLRLVFGGFIQVMEEMSEYLLNPGRLVLQPEYMYVDLEKRELFFCYLPGYEKDIRIQFQCLTEYILPRLDHEDSQAVMLGYGIYRRALEDSFHLEHIKEELFRKRSDEDVVIKQEVKDSGVWKEDPKSARIPEGKDLWMEDGSAGMQAETPLAQSRTNKRNQNRKSVENRKKDTEKREIPWKEIGGCMTGAGVGLLILAARIWGYLPQIPFWLLLSVMVSFMGIGTLAAVLLERKETRNAEIVYNQRSTPMQKSEDSFSQVGSVGAKEEDNELLGETVVLSSGNVYGPSTLVSKEPGELATIYLNEDLTVIGKLENAADAVINLPTVSRMHAKIRKREGEYYLTDLNSRNGTAVNGQMLKPEEDYLLQDQDEVDFAQARYIFIKIG
ncbi:MAG: DUF6382 domain-containing protein [Blautia sp.]